MSNKIFLAIINTWFTCINEETKPPSPTRFLLSPSVFRILTASPIVQLAPIIIVILQVVGCSIITFTGYYIGHRHTHSLGILQTLKRYTLTYSYYDNHSDSHSVGDTQTIVLVQNIILQVYKN